MKVVIPGRFPGLNEFIAACRKSHGKWSGGNAMKQESQKRIMWHLPRNVRFKRVFLEYTFYEENARRDKDNIMAFFVKVFQDSLVEMRIIENDGWKQIDGMAFHFLIDKKRPRVEIEIREVK